MRDEGKEKIFRSIRDLRLVTRTLFPFVDLFEFICGELQKLTDKGRNPHFIDSSDRIYYTEDADSAKENEPAHELVSVDTNGTDRRVHARSNYASKMEVSPSGEYIAFRENFHVYVVPMPPGGTLDLSPKTKSVRVVRASEIGGDYLNWTDGDTLTWSLGPTLYRGEISALFPKPVSGGTFLPIQTPIA